MRAHTLVVTACVTLLFVACGGPDHPTTPPSGGGLTTVSGMLSGPRDPAGLTVLSVYDSTAVATDGGFRIRTMTGRQIVVAVDPTVPDVVYLGLLDGDHPDLGPRSTAEVLLYEALGGPFFLGPVRDLMWDDPAFAADVDSLAAVIRSGYAGGAATLRDLADTLRSVLLALPLVAAARAAGGADSTKALVNPPGGRSGIDLDTSAPRQLVIRNNYRRRALAWVDRVEGVDAGGQVIPYGDQVAEVDVSPTTAYTNVLGTLIDAINGNYLWAPVASSPVALPLQPADGRRTTYDVWVLGLGGAVGDYTDLSASRQDRFRSLAVQSVVLDFVLPIVTNVAIPAQGEQIEDFLNWVGGSGVLSDFLGTLTSAVPGIWQKALDGDLHGAITDAFNAIATSNTLGPVFFERMGVAIQDYYEGGLGIDQANMFWSGAEAFLTSMGYVDILGTVMDSALQVRHILASDIADHWQVTVFPDRLTLDPRHMVLAPGRSHDLTVTVADAGNRAFAYHWRCGRGVLRDGYHVGQEFDSSQASVGYQAGDEGDDVVSVEVFEIRGSDRVRIGEASAAVTVKNAVPYLAPRLTSLREEDRQVFTLRMEHGYDGDGPLFYRWRGGDRHGEHDGHDFIGTRDQVTYHALSDGVDSLFCDVYVAVNGAMLPLGTAAAEIRVEEEPTVIFGHYVTHVWEDTSAGRYGVYADVVWDKVPGGTYYTLRGYGGYDPYWYLGGPIERGVDPDHQIHDHAGEIPPGEIWVSLSGQWGGIDYEADAISYMESRFATGWIWEVTVQR